MSSLRLEEFSRRSKGDENCGSTLGLHMHGRVAVIPCSVQSIIAGVKLYCKDSLILERGGAGETVGKASYSAVRKLLQP